MIEVARRADVGSATLYRNFPSREALLEALLFDEVAALSLEAATTDAPTAGARLDGWLRRISHYVSTERPVALDLLAHETADTESLISRTRAHLTATGAPLLAAAQDEGTVRGGVDFGQVLDLVMAIASSPQYKQPILDIALAGLRPVD
jgi:AcrR family transcriptional regulator